MTINLTQIRSDFDNGIIVSKQTLLALVDYASELEKANANAFTPDDLANIVTYDNEPNEAPWPVFGGRYVMLETVLSLIEQKANHAL
jgi:hypothetical protein